MGLRGRELATTDRQLAVLGDSTCSAGHTKAVRFSNGSGGSALNEHNVLDEESRPIVGIGRPGAADRPSVAHALAPIHGKCISFAHEQS